jgi:hypothetical protein
LEPQSLEHYTLASLEQRALAFMEQQVLAFLEQQSLEFLEPSSLLLEFLGHPQISITIKLASSSQPLELPKTRELQQS